MKARPACADPRPSGGNDALYQPAVELLADLTGFDNRRHVVPFRLDG
jgi:hypothetical protein